MCGSWSMTGNRHGTGRIHDLSVQGLLENKRVLFITTKNLDYIRNMQEIRLIEKHAANTKIIGADDSGYGKRLVKVFWQLLSVRAKNYDVVFIGFAPQLVLPVLHGKFRKNQVLIDFFISMYDTFVCDRQIIRRGSPPAGILHWIDGRTLRLADYVIADTRAHRDFFASEFGVGLDRLDVLYLEADRNLYYPRVSKAGRYPGKYTVLYFGSILPLQGVETVIAAAEQLKDNDKIRFIVIGPEKKGVPRYRGDNIEYIDWLSQQELAERIAGADLCLAGHFNADIDKAKRTIPGKAYIYEAMEKPMILGDNPANHEIFEADERHYFVEMGNAAELAERISCIVKDMESRKG